MTYKIKFIFILLGILCPATLFGQHNYTSESFYLKGKVKSITAKSTYSNIDPEKLEFSVEGNLIYDSLEIVENYSFYTIRHFPDSTKEPDFFYSFDGYETYDSLGLLIFKSTYEYTIDQSGEYEFISTRCFLYDKVGNLSECRSYYDLDYDDVLSAGYSSMLSGNKPYEAIYYVYEYDLNGNWINRKGYSGEILIDSITRIISYY